MSQYQLTDHMEDLHEAECLRLLEEGSLGRIGATARGHPVIFPVNYVAIDGAILFCTRRGGELDTAAVDATVAFEIDGLDHVYHEGWSVLTIGRCVHVTAPVELAQIRGLRLSSWAGRGRDLMVRVSMMRSADDEFGTTRRDRQRECAALVPVVPVPGLCAPQC